MSAQDNTGWRRILYEEIGALCRVRREGAGISREEAAFALGYSKQTIARTEDGMGVTVAYLTAFAQLAKCDVASLIPHIPTTFNRKIGRSEP